MQVKDLEERKQNINQLLQQSRDVLIKNSERVKELLKLFCKEEETDPSSIKDLGFSTK